ncbi:MAG: corrinoid protein [Desulfobacterales bacterium]
MEVQCYEQADQSYSDMEKTRTASRMNGGRNMDTLKSITESLINGQDKKVKELVHTALEEGISVDRILNDGLISGMDIVGQKFKQEDIFLPEVLFAARSMNGAMEILEPMLVGQGIEPIGKIVLGSVKGDVHDIGKNLVGMMLKGAGFMVVDIGVDVSPEQFVEAAQENVQLIGMSALLSTTMASMATTIDALKEAGVTTRIKTMVGGAIVTQGFADKIGADGYAPDAVAAVAKVKELLGIGTLQGQ